VSAVRYLANLCVASDCRVDADCGANGACSPLIDQSGCGGNGIAGFYCRTPNDTCADDSDCATGVCGYDFTAKHWACVALSEC
jgi:hypothetical protein